MKYTIDKIFIPNAPSVLDAMPMTFGDYKVLADKINEILDVLSDFGVSTPDSKVNPNITPKEGRTE